MQPSSCHAFGFGAPVMSKDRQVALYGALDDGIENCSRTERDMDKVPLLMRRQRVAQLRN